MDSDDDLVGELNETVLDLHIIGENRMVEALNNEDNGHAE